MGDIADMVLDQVWDEEDLRSDYRCGLISDVDAYDMGIVDELGGYKHPPLFGNSRCASKTCTHCGKTKLVWKETEKGWRLADSEGKIHQCPQYIDDM